MPITIDILDGQYEVRSQTEPGGPFTLDGDGLTVIKNGLTYRKDKNGCIWESSFSIAGPDKVEIESTVDPTHADAFILDAKGNPTKSIVSFKSVLDAKLVDGKVVMTGLITHGGLTTRLMLQQV